MATLSITVDDTKVAILRDAYGATTNLQLKQAIIADIRQRAVNYLVGKAYADGEPSIQVARVTVTASGEAAKAEGEAISIT